MKATDLRPGMAVTMSGKLYICTQATHVTPGNLRAFVQAKLKCLTDGTIIEKRLRSGEDLDEAFLDKREMEYLYSDNTGHVLMDTKTFDQMTVSDEILGEFIKYFKPNTSLVVLTNDGNVVSAEMPKTVDLAVTETTPVLRSATITNQMKDATLETGLRVRVPIFITIGEVVRISTEDGSYLGRAK